MSNVQNCILLICKYDTKKNFAPPPPHPQTVPMALNSLAMYEYTHCVGLVGSCEAILIYIMQPERCSAATHFIDTVFSETNYMYSKTIYTTLIILILPICFETLH